ncbi:hypothetical protein VNI00_005121 [Paramarasmius palmivorus]|uniref:Uncharacterized protein n=1 Tax=Paramarasmius palmivorus TaxID=297713 RepID=A0AAW0DIU9_9AGAR
MSSYSVQLGFSGQYPPQKTERDQIPYDHYPQAYGAHHHTSYYPPPTYSMPPYHGGPQNPFPGAPSPFPDHRIPPPQPQFAPPGQFPTPAKVNGSSLKKKLYDLTVGQEVEVCLKANVFVVGCVLSVLTFFEKIAGYGYEIRYKALGGDVTDVFSVDKIRTR